MDKLCTRLTTSYNTTILDDVNKITQAVFYDESKKHKDKKRGLTTMMALVYNHYKANKPKPRFIGGPKTLSLHWSDKYQKMIYIFGERHARSSDCPKPTPEQKCGLENKVYNPKTHKCVSKTGKIGKEIIALNKTNKISLEIPIKMEIEDFLELLIENTDAFIDAYFEFPIYSGDKYRNINYYMPGNLQRLMTRFETCLQYATRAAEKCKLSRIHYFDTRSIDSDDKSRMNDLSYFTNTMYYFDATATNDITSNNITRNIVKNIITIDYRVRTTLEGLNAPTEQEFITFWNNQIKQSHYVMKELNKSPLKTEILNFITNEVLTKALQRRKVIQYYIEILYNDSSTSKFFLDALSNILFYITSPVARLTDAYTLARIFRDFDIEKPSFADAGERDQPQKAHNIIIYAGNAHSITYRVFLESIGFKELARAGSDDFTIEPGNCIDMKNFPQPFFSHMPENKGFLDKLFG